MRCTKCNHELDEHGICPNCYHIHDVQTMSNREINNLMVLQSKTKIIIAKKQLKKISNNINNLIIIDIIVHHVLVA